MPCWSNGFLEENFEFYCCSVLFNERWLIFKYERPLIITAVLHLHTEKNLIIIYRNNCITSNSNKQDPSKIFDLCVFVFQSRFLTCHLGFSRENNFKNLMFQLLNTNLTTISCGWFVGFLNVLQSFIKKN